MTILPKKPTLADWLKNSQPVSSPADSEPGTSIIQVVKKDEPALIVTPRPEMDGGSRQMGEATLVPHPSGIAPRGPKVLYTRDGIPTYVETLVCTGCGCYFTLTFTDPKNHSKNCMACWRKAKDAEAGIVRTFPTTVIGPTSSPVASQTSSSGITPRYYGSGGAYTSYGHSWVSPRKEFDEFFASLGSFTEAKTANSDDADDEDDKSWRTRARHMAQKAGAKKSKRERKRDRKRLRRIHPDAL